jgi:ABC-type methionine transport system ATPase subunit
LSDSTDTTLCRSSRGQAQHATDIARRVWTQNTGEAIEAFEAWWNAEKGPGRATSKNTALAAELIGAGLGFIAATRLICRELISKLIQAIETQIARPQWVIWQLSGGQQQRVAVARALANDPQLLIADEPTGQLDSTTGRSIMDLIRAVVRARGMTALVATHDPALIDLADRVVVLRDGALADPVTV